ncbi:MAG: V-type ATP synthase subunit A [Actinomycetes bacterium]
MTATSDRSPTGRVTRVNGPLVELAGLGGIAMFEVVELGGDRVPGEIVAISGDRVMVQAYEYTGGLAPGAPALPQHAPLSALLGPHLLGGVFDGLLRPLAGAGDRLTPAGRSAGPTRAAWQFTPLVRADQPLGPGAVFGTVVMPGGAPHRVLVPPGVRGRVTAIRPAGPVRLQEPVGSVGDQDVPLATLWPVRRPRPYRERLDEIVPLITGQRVIDLLLPVPRGGTAAVPGGFGTGKTVLLQQIAKWGEADVVVYVGCGERGNEMADIVAELAELDDPRTGGRLADRTVVIANTSNMPMMAREASIYSAVTVAEYYRDMGLDAVVIADSTSRWAEALREFASRSGALPAEEGYPADLASALAAFYERAGRVTTLGERTGSVTIIGAVSPAGGDLTEPVTVHTQRFVRSLWTLDRDLAYARHYPAVSWTGSFARDAAAVAAWYARRGDPGWADRRARVAGLLTEAGRLGELAELVGVAALPGRERMVMLAGELLRQGLLQQSALSRVDAFSAPEKTAALADAVLAVADHCRQAAEAGVPATALEELDFGPLVRARDEVGAVDIAGITGRRDTVLTQLRALR